MEFLKAYDAPTFRSVRKPPFVGFDPRNPNKLKTDDAVPRSSPFSCERRWAYTSNSYCLENF